MHSVNDILSSSRTLSVTTGNAIVTGPCRIFSMAVSAAAGATGVLTIYNALTATGTSIQIKAPATGSSQFTFGREGIRFDTGLTIASSGTPDGTAVTYLAE
jgi:hypothetical protein